MLPAPEEPAHWPEWRRELAAFRREARERLRYDTRMYDAPAFAWTRASFSCCVAMAFDERLYDPRAGRWTLNAFLDEGQREFGGYDSLVYWHAYPRIGFDPRNQFDFYRDMPGGLPALAGLSDDLHAKGLRAFVDYNPWDTSTRREPVGDAQAMTGIVAATKADGVFLDTLASGAGEWRGVLDAARPGVALESELALPLAHVHDHHLSWAQGLGDGRVPGVLRNKWFERRHMMHVIDRWSRDHTAELHTAWMNGTGMMVWENVFGSPVPWSPRDRSILRAMLPIQRRFVDLFTSESGSGEGWTPLVDRGLSGGDDGVYASLWERGGVRLWTLVNRTEESKPGAPLEVADVAGSRYFDLVAGCELEGRTGAGRRRMELAMRSRAIGAVVAMPADAVTPDFEAFLSRQRELDARADWRAAQAPPAQRRLLPDLAASPLPADAKSQPGMAVIAARKWSMVVAFRERECGFYEDPAFRPLTPAVLDQIDQGKRHDIGESGSVADGRLHQAVVRTRRASVGRYAIDKVPVTNAEFDRFLAATGYRPAHAENFLRHWVDGRPPAGLEEHPVVYVDLGDARAYAAWAGKRLPSEEEWQLAAQGALQHLYPWGDEWLPERCNTGSTTTPVLAFPRGKSASGCLDLCGNVWEWTESERTDGWTRFCILKGGSHYRASGSDWYADGGPRYCNYAAKFILMWPGLDRCSTIGFRCARG
ncbi:MAG: SUMF1/EgtB/PvdO family nonheme iron enzyme [Planctomycetota bacterium]|nr:SUMF1/EgtB/PvdO family nonheme iron enzyme [Planctomycetota bacterium]